MSAPKWYRVQKSNGSWSGWYRSAKAAAGAEEGIVYQHDSKGGPGRKHGASIGGFSFPEPEPEPEVVHSVRLEPDEYRPVKNKFRRLRSKQGLHYVKGTGYDWECESGTLSARYIVDEEEHLASVDLSWGGKPDDDIWAEVLGLFGVDASRVNSITVRKKRVEKTHRWSNMAKREVDRVLDFLQRGAWPLPSSLRAIKREEMLSCARSMDDTENMKAGAI